MKKIVALILCAAFVLSGVACSAGGSGGGSKLDQITFTNGEWNLKEAAAPWKGETLHFIGEALPPLQALQDLAPEFTEITGVNVQVEMYGQEEVNQKTTADFVGKTGIYDLVLGPHRQMGTYVENDWLYPMSFLRTRNSRIRASTSRATVFSIRDGGRSAAGTTDSCTPSRSTSFPCTPGTVTTTSRIRSSRKTSRRSTVMICPVRRLRQTKFMTSLKVHIIP